MERTCRTSCCPRRFSRGRGGTGVFPTSSHPAGWANANAVIPAAPVCSPHRVTRAEPHVSVHSAELPRAGLCFPTREAELCSGLRVPANPVACAPSASRPLSSVESPGCARAGAPNLPGVSESYVEKKSPRRAVRDSWERHGTVAGSVTLVWWLLVRL